MRTIGIALEMNHKLSGWIFRIDTYSLEMSEGDDGPAMRPRRMTEGLGELVVAVQYCISL
jgi:hypothetical protein